MAERKMKEVSMQPKDPKLKMNVANGTAIEHYGRKKVVLRGIMNEINNRNAVGPKCGVCWVCDEVVQAEPLGGLGDSLRLTGIERQRLGGFDRAETAGTGTAIAGDHESRGATAPALPTVGALRFFTNRDQIEIVDHALG